MSNRTALLLSVAAWLNWSCEKAELILDNPLDPANPGYVPPEVSITSGPGEAEVVNTSAVSFGWEGNDQVSEYRWKLDAQDWSDWIQGRSVQLRYLDEGNHSFSIQSRYPSEAESDVVTLTFVVDAVEGPALMFYPRRRVVSLGSRTTLQVLAEEVTDLTAAEFSIDFNPGFLEVVSVSEGSMFQEQGESIFFSEVDNSTGKATVSAAMLGGEEPSVDGTGILAIIEIEVLSRGSTTLTFDGSEVFRDPQNNSLTIVERIDGRVEGE